MKNRFFEKPDENFIMEMRGFFCLHDAVVAIDSTDVKECLEGASNVIILSGNASGYNRCADAIEDAVLHANKCDHDLFSADSVILYVVCPKSEPMLMSENEAINAFMQLFRPGTQWKWGLAEKSDIDEMSILLIASNLKSKQ